MEHESIPTLYQSLLGSKFDCLPPVLNEFHARREGGYAEGLVTVEHGRGLRSCLARLLRLPPEGLHLPLRLEVVAHDDKERWIRIFGTQRLETLQWQEDGYLIEKAGGLEFVFLVTVTSSGMDFNSLYSRLGEICIPAWASLHVSAVVVGTGSGWTVKVCISAPVLGTLATYTGEVVPHGGPVQDTDNPRQKH